VVWDGRTLDDEIRSQDTHGGDTDAGFRGAVGGAEAGEDDGAGAAHRSEERLVFVVSAVFFQCIGLSLFAAWRCEIGHIDASQSCSATIEIAGLKVFVVSASRR
jgi:hypothetical protein